MTYDAVSLRETNDIKILQEQEKIIALDLNCGMQQIRNTIMHLKKQDKFRNKDFFGMIVGSEIKYTQYDVVTLLKNYCIEKYQEIENEKLKWVYVPLDFLEYSLPLLKSDLSFERWHQILDEASFHPFSLIADMRKKYGESIALSPFFSYVENYLHRLNPKIVE